MTAEQLAQFEHVSGVFERELAAADPEARLRGIPDWNVAQLTGHLGAVHNWVVEILANGRRMPRDNAPQVDEPLVAFYARARARLLDAFATTPEGQRTYTHQPSNQTVGYWHRRQLLETLVHLSDLRSARGDASVGEVAPPAVFVDGLRELPEVWVPLGDEPEIADFTSVIRFEPTDIDDPVTLGPGFRYAQQDAVPDAVIAAPAHELLLIAWNRTEPRFVGGDHEVYEKFRAAPIRP